MVFSYNIKVIACSRFVHISWVNFRDIRVNWNEELSLRAVCEDCGDVADLTYSWDLFLVNATEKNTVEGNVVTLFLRNEKAQGCSVIDEPLHLTYPRLGLHLTSVLQTPSDGPKIVSHICALRRLGPDSLGLFYWLRITGSHCKGSVMKLTIQSCGPWNCDICGGSVLHFPDMQLLKSLASSV